MKHLKYTASILFIGLISMSCGKEAKELKNDLNNSTEAVKNAKKVADAAPEMQKTAQELRNITPLTKGQFESWLPETLLDMPLTFSQINFMPGLSSCGANYTLGNKRIKIMVIDGAGEKGSGAVGTYKLYSKMDYDTIDENRYKKTRIIDGVKVVEAYRKSGNTYSLSMFYGERFGVHIEIFELEQHVLDKSFKALNLSELETL